MVILKKYKDTLDDFIDSSDLEFPDWAGLIDGRFCNAPKSENSSVGLSRRTCWNKDIPDKLSRLTAKTTNLQVRQRRVVASQVGYGKS